MLAAISKQWVRGAKVEEMVFIRSANILRSCDKSDSLLIPAAQ
ncbi:hypothetical protein ACLK1S_08650 [Escherichia coli]